MAAKKQDETHILVESTDNLFSLQSDRILPGHPSNGSKRMLCATATLLALVTLISLGALAVSLYTVWVSERQGSYREWNSKKILQQEESERNALFEVS
jgi:hypothetical protein